MLVSLWSGDFWSMLQVFLDQVLNISMFPTRAHGFFWFLSPPVTGVCELLETSPSTPTQAPPSTIETVLHVPLLPPRWVVCRSKCRASQDGLWGAWAAPTKLDQQWLLGCPQSASSVDWLLSVPEIWPLGGEEGSRFFTFDTCPSLLLLFLLTQKCLFFD